MLDNSQLTCGVEAQRVPALPAGLDYGHDHAYGLAMATVVLLRALGRCREVVSAGPDGRDRLPGAKLNAGSEESASTVSDPWRSGTIAGRFRIVRFIDRGGMGEVYEAEDLAIRTRPRLALKIIREEISSNAAVVAHFEREVELSKRVTHPNVCRTYDLGIDQRLDAAGRPVTVLFLTMELLLGETLAGRLRDRGPLSRTEALPIICQIAAAIDAVHAAGVVHADLKPSNIMLTPQAGGAVRAVLTDFGLAAACVTDNSCGHDAGDALVGGTPDFMSPEQVLRGPIRPASDIYSLGVIIYRILTGQLPFDGGCSTERMRRRLTEDPVPPGRYAELDPRWERAILKCLAKDPAQRFERAYDAVAAMLTPEAPRDRRAPWR